MIKMIKRLMGIKIMTTFALAAIPDIVFAAVAEGVCRSAAGGYCVNLAAAFPGLEFLGEAVGLGDLIARLYVWGLGFVGISALLVFIYGGVKYMVAGDRDPTEAKKAMTNAVIGLVVALLSWLILFTINPDLVTKFGRELKPITIKSLVPQFENTTKIQGTTGPEVKKGIEDCESRGGVAATSPNRGFLCVTKDLEEHQRINHSLDEASCKNAGGAIEFLNLKDGGGGKFCNKPFK